MSKSRRAVLLPPPWVQEVGRFRVVRDDTIRGGTKVRAFVPLMRVAYPQTREWVYASPTYGYAQVSLAIAARMCGVRATVFVPKRSVLHDYTLIAQEEGAFIVQVPMGFLSNCEAKAAAYTNESKDRFKVPMSGDLPYVLHCLTNVAKLIDGEAPDEVWTAISGGVLSRALQEAWPKARFFGVQVGHKVTSQQAGRAEIIVADQKFEQAAKHPPPFPSASNYDAKVWRYMLQYGSPGAVFWNVAG